MTLPSGRTAAYDESNAPSQQGLPAGTRSSRTWVVLVLAALAALLLIVDPLSWRSPPPAGPGTYAWETVRVDGGGWVTGVVPTPSGAVYARTDVGGAYRWEQEGEGRWRQLLTYDGVSDPVSSDYKVEGLAVAPSDDDVVYLAVGDSVQDRHGSILRSDDGGRTWDRSAQQFTIHGNAEWRQAGARLAVSPDDADVVYFGSRTEGLWRSDDAGAEWEQLTSLPVRAPLDDGDPAGVTFVRFGPAQLADEAPRVLWVGVEGVGVLRSEDGGGSWDVVLDTPGGVPKDAEVSEDGRLYVVVVGQSGGVYRVAPGDDDATSISPGGNPAVLAVDPADPDRVIVGDDGVRDGFLWRSTDAGDTWDTLDVAIRSPDARWPTQTDLEDYMSAGDLAFDPARPGTLWFAEGMGAWRSEDLQDDEVTWTFASHGIEELVSNDAVKPAGRSLITAHWDRNLFRHPADGPAEPGLTPRFNSAWSLATAPDDASFVVAVVDDHRFCCEDDGLAGQSGYSQDGGRSWRRFASLESEQHPDELAFGNIAVSAGDTDNLVWVPSNGGQVHYSRDRGQTWTPADYPGSEPHFAHYLQRDVLTTDQERPGTFYVLDAEGVLRSTDGGATWQLRQGHGLPDRHSRRFNATLSTVPGATGELLLTTGLLDEGSHGLFRSTDGGDTWTEEAGLADVGRFGFGRAADRDDVPLLFATGRQGGTRGLWRSQDLGRTWELLTHAPGGRYQDVTVLAGDPDVPGRVYVGFSGTGFVVGTPR